MIAAASVALSAASLFSVGLSKLGQSFAARDAKDNNGGLSLSGFAAQAQDGQNLPVSPKGAAISAQPSEETRASFAKLDTKADGSLSVNAYNQQLVQQLQSAMIELQQVLGQGQEGINAPGGAGRHHKHASLADKFASIDANSDNSLSKDEMTAFFAGKSGATDAAASMEKLFALADTDKNGVLSKDELAAFDAGRKKKPQGAHEPIAALLQALDQANASMQGQGGQKNRAAAGLLAANAYRAAS